MNLNAISDSQLLIQTSELVKKERELLHEILLHLHEIDRRRLYSELGYKSLFDYATKKLGYAEDQAARRLSAMRLLRDLPEIEEKIASGALTLTNLSLAQTLFRREQKHSQPSVAWSSLEERQKVTPCLGFSNTQKLEILAQLENQSKREAEKIIFSHSSCPNLLTPDRIRSVGEEAIELKFRADVGLREKIEHVKDLLAHTRPDMNLADVIGVVCDMAIKQLEPRKQDVRSLSKAKAKAKSAKTAPVSKRRITSCLRRLVWRKAEGQCEKCGSRRALQVDHIKPKSMGGEDDVANLRLLCRACNQREAINQLGMQKMQRYLMRRESRSP